MTEGYELTLLEDDEETRVWTQEYPTLPDTARAMIAVYDTETNPGLLDENGEMTLRVQGTGGRTLTRDESLSLFALCEEFGANCPSGDDADEIGWLRMTNPNRRT